MRFIKGVIVHEDLNPWNPISNMVPNVFFQFKSTQYETIIMPILLAANVAEEAFAARVVGLPIAKNHGPNVWDLIHR